eukprot:TRINITY_DN4179_c0_g1_i1.p1 TRINITY_DN4179_c0_g1~~TRINITY_DN4179_c0_g1_i1.p1  ORF type:complete len:1212 (-),score=248.16 TRINITY_DN4179_c0_g1_i1:31-3666(-)
MESSSSAMHPHKLSKSIAHISYYTPRHPFLKLNVIPFLIVIAFALWTYFMNEVYSTIALYTTPIFILLFFTSFLAQYWSVEYNATISYHRVHNLKDAQFVKVVPNRHKGSKELCPILKESFEERDQLYFLYQQRKYVLSQSEGNFQKITFPVNLTFQEYQKHVGMNDDADLTNARRKWGFNKLDIPLPTFGELYKEQALAPFFAFQMFCVLLWCMDEYWYYSIFTLFMLLIFEATVAQSRLRNFTQLRAMANKPAQFINVWRKGKWNKISSWEIVPGDLCSVVREESKEEKEALEASSSSPKALSPPLNTPKHLEQPTNPFLPQPPPPPPKPTASTGVIPCDMLLVSGVCIVNEAMLTGESTPHHKEPIILRDGDERLDIKRDKLHVLYAGTQVLQQQSDNITINNNNKQSKIPKPPDNGCIAYVLRTGFDTSEGRLMRTILFSSTRITANTLESLLFILFLMVFAIAASGYVLYNGIIDETRSRYRLLINCILIITSVVPPELPMELSMAVNSSLIALVRLGIFCTEPFRIPYAGKVDLCCFDKTGTLTTDDLVMIGVAGLDPAKGESSENDISIPPLVFSPVELPDQVQVTLAGCQSLVFLDGKLVGDPMEIAALNSMEWSFAKNDYASSKRGKGGVKILHRFHFSSSLQRMSTIVTIDGVQIEKSSHTFVTAKGSPEIMKNLFAKIPDNYDNTYKYFSRRGQRVLALGYKPLRSMNQSEAKQFPRESAESSLIFAGFVLFDCPLKPDAFKALEMLRKSSHAVVMITGDNALTACQVAKNLGMIDDVRITLILQIQDGSLVWVSVDESVVIPFTPSSSHIPTLCKTYSLCVPGPTISQIQTLPPRHLGMIKIYARVSPEQKELILSSMKTGGYTTLMAGDGVNDVGALKQAHVGVAILNKGELKQNKQPLSPFGQAMAQAQAQNSALKQRKTGGSTPKTGPVSLAEKLQEMEKAEEIPIVQLGDASIAAPFTSKSSAVVPITHVIRQGRCTLVTTLQMYKILALNCLVSAYSLSVLYLDGVKMGDTQATVAGMLIAMCFLFISRSKPLEELSPERPERNVFSPYMMTSIIGQFCVHLYSLIYTVQLAKKYLPEDVPKPDPDGDFTPNLVNSAVFLITCASQVSTFAINYRGHPFMQSLRENKGLLYCLSAVGGLTLLCASEIMPDFNESFEIVPFPNSVFRAGLMTAIILDFVVAFIIESASRALFQKG